MLQRPRILVVDNDSASLRQMQAMLRDMGTAPRCVSSSADAVEVINREKFDGVFLTWNLRDINGRRLTERIRTSRSNSRVAIALLGEPGSVSSMSEAFESGVTFFFSKPVGPTELRRLVNAGRASMLEERRRYQRAPMEVPVKCTYEKKVFTGKTLNISSIGVLLRLEESLEPGSPVRLAFNLPRPRMRMELDGLVARIRPGNKVAVKFLGLSPEQQAVIMDYADRAVRAGGVS